MVSFNSVLAALSSSRGSQVDGTIACRNAARVVSQGGEPGDWQHAIDLLETMRVLVVPRGPKHSNQSSYKHRREILRGEYQTKSELENENHHFQAQYVRDFWF